MALGSQLVAEVGMEPILDSPITFPLSLVFEQWTPFPKVLQIKADLTSAIVSKYSWKNKYLHRISKVMVYTLFFLTQFMYWGGGMAWVKWLCLSFPSTESAVFRNELHRLWENEPRVGDKFILKNLAMIQQGEYHTYTWQCAQIHMMFSACSFHSSSTLCHRLLLKSPCIKKKEDWGRGFQRGEDSQMRNSWKTPVVYAKPGRSIPLDYVHITSLLSSIYRKC